MNEECKNCSGKGYSTVLEQVCEGRQVNPPRIMVRICSHCQRGTDLRKYFDVKKKHRHPLYP